MRNIYVGIVFLLAPLVPTTAFAATPAPLAALHDLAGTWHCTYRGGAVRMAYENTFAFDLDGHALRQTTSWAGGGGDEELLTYDAQHGAWTAVVLDDHGNATVLRATGRNPNHIAYRSVYPDAGIAVTFDRVSAGEYTLHATARYGGKTITSVDSCSR
jgi:hypothetical protein